MRTVRLEFAVGLEEGENEEPAADDPEDETNERSETVPVGRGPVILRVFVKPAGRLKRLGGRGFVFFMHGTSQCGSLSGAP